MCLCLHVRVCACVYVCVCVRVCVCVCVNGIYAVKVLHLSAASRQDVPSLGGGSQLCVYM